MPLVDPNATPEINDNIPAATPAPDAPAFSLDAVVNDAVKAPDFKIVEDKVIRSDTKLPEEQEFEAAEEPKLSKEAALEKAKKELADESKKTKKEVAAKVGEKATPKDDESGETESDESEEEDKSGEEGSEQTQEEVKLHGNTKRDYSGFTANQIKALKKLDNSRFQSIATEWRALNSAASKAIELAGELENQKKIAEGKGIPDAWYQHPEAYTLTPEFRNLSTQFAQYDAVENHYASQLAAIQDGKPWTAVTGVDANGNLQFSPPQEANAVAFAQVSRALNQATTFKGQLQGKVDNLALSFQISHKQAETELNNEVQKFIDKLHPDVKPQEVDINNALGSMHPMYRNHPVTKSFARSVAINFAQGRMIQKLLAEKEQGAKIAADKKLAGPRGSNNLPKVSPAASAKNGKNILSLDAILADN